MSQYHRTDLTEGNDLARSNNSNEWLVSHYSSFFSLGLNFDILFVMAVMTWG